MSGEGPESIPTSADPRSKRPTKKRALTPNSAHAAGLEALFARPEQEIRIPTGGDGGGRSRLAAPPEIVTNVQGSSAGAGSGEFHVYKAARRREYERLRRMDDEVRAERDADEFDTTRAERERKDDEKTRRNREKREKMKARKAKAKGGAPAAAAAKNGVAPKPAKGPRIDSKRAEAGNDGEEDEDADEQMQEGAGSAAAQEVPGIVIEED